MICRLRFLMENSYTFVSQKLYRIWDSFAVTIYIVLRNRPFITFIKILQLDIKMKVGKNVNTLYFI